MLKSKEFGTRLLLCFMALATFFAFNVVFTFLSGVLDLPRWLAIPAYIAGLYWFRWMWINYRNTNRRYTSRSS